ncbi:serine kinase [Shimia sp. WX04]|uniref:HPr kinase/phosphorylase n=1 Tax=Shimia ponticola TaxID=2582893 RepID=UPI0011BE912A
MTPPSQSIWESRSTNPDQFVLHATAVVANGRALVLGGPPGIGKSKVAVHLMALGAQLIADDMVWIRKSDQGVMAAALPNAPECIELSHIGLCPATLAKPAAIAACVDLRPTDVPRRPTPQFMTLFGHDVRLIHTSREGPFVPALWHYLIGSGAEQPT